MRKPLNNIVDTSTTKKPYVTDDFNEMRESVTNKEVEDKGVVTKHSEFEKPYRLNWNQGYMDMQTQHPSNFTFPYGQPQKADTPKANKFTPIGEPPLSQDILSCLHFNSLCFCIACSSAINPFNGFDCNQKVDDGCQQLVCDSPEEDCPPFTLSGGDSAPTTLCPSADICAIDIQGGSADDKCVKVPDEGCGVKNVCITDICGKQVCKEVRMSEGVWVLVSSQGCSSFLIECSVMEGKTMTVYDWRFCCGVDSLGCSDCFAQTPGCLNSRGTPSCIGDAGSCQSGQNLIYCNIILGIHNYEWRCP